MKSKPSSNTVDGIIYARMYHGASRFPRNFTKSLQSCWTRPPLTVQSPQWSRMKSPPQKVQWKSAAAGHTRIGMINNIDDIPATHGRLEGYRNALIRNGLPEDPRLVASAVSDTVGGRQAAAELLSLPDRPTALFCFNDRMAMGAYQSASAAGLRIPEDLSVVGMDNLELIADALWRG